MEQFTQDRLICRLCVGNETLQELIDRSEIRAECTYCQREAVVCALTVVGNAVRNAMESFYVQTPERPNRFEEYIAVKDGNEWERRGQPVVDTIAELTNVSRAAADDIRGLIREMHMGAVEPEIEFNEGPFATTAHFSKIEIYDNSIAESYDEFELSLRHKSRFFNPLAKEMLHKLLGDVSDLRDKNELPVVQLGGPQTDFPEIYRGRLCHTWSKALEILKDPTRELGPPPDEIATAGRMNAHGISVFYGATTKEVALAEVRAYAGSHVVSGLFRIRRQIRLLNVNRLAEVLVEGSVFDSGHADRLRRAAFLKQLSDRITRPVAQNSEPLSYLSTQALADYLVSVMAPRIDGIIYASAQTADPGFNVALFQTASKVDQSNARNRVNEVRSRQGLLDADLAVFEGAPDFPIFGSENDFNDIDQAAMLELEPNSLTVHRVDSIKVTSTDRPVRWVTTEDFKIAKDRIEGGPF